MLCSVQFWPSALVGNKQLLCHQSAVSYPQSTVSSLSMDKIFDSPIPDPPRIANVSMTFLRSFNLISGGNHGSLESVLEP